MKTIKLSEIFEPKYGVNLELNKLDRVDTLDENSILFVSRTARNNGVSAIVKKIDGIEPNPAKTISIAGGGSSVLEAFYQSKPYYSGRDLYYLTPRSELTVLEIVFYCLCIRKNRFKYGFGRQANKTLGDILLPDYHEIPSWVNEIDLDNLVTFSVSDFSFVQQKHTEKSQDVLLKDVFDFHNGLASSKVERFETRVSNDFIPYVRPSNSQKTSIDAFVDKNKIPKKFIFPPNTLYVSTDGQGSHTYSYVSTFEFVPNSNVTVLIPKKQMSLQEKIYYSIAISHNRFKFSYGRKPKGDRLKYLLIPSETPEYIFDEFFFSEIISDINKNEF